MPNIHDLRKQMVNVTQQVIEKKQDIIENDLVEKVVFDENILIKVSKLIEEFSEKSKEDDHMFIYYLLKDKNIRSGKGIFIVDVDNDVQLSQLNDIKIDLCDYIKLKMPNLNFTIEGNLQKIEKEKMLYTTTDKFAYLCEKNPKLIYLKQKLGLETDF